MRGYIWASTDPLRAAYRRLAKDHFCKAVQIWKSKYSSVVATLGLNPPTGKRVSQQKNSDSSVIAAAASSNGSATVTPAVSITESMARELSDLKTKVADIQGQLASISQRVDGCCGQHDGQRQEYRHCRP